MHRPRAHATLAASSTGSLPAGHEKLAHVAVHTPETHPAPLLSASQSSLVRHPLPGGHRPMAAPPVVMLLLVVNDALLPGMAATRTLLVVPASTRQVAPQSTPVSSPSRMPLLHEPAPIEMVPTTRGRPPVWCRQLCVRQNRRRSAMPPHMLRLPSSTAVRRREKSPQLAAWNVHTCSVGWRIAHPRGASARSGHAPARRSASSSSSVTLAATALCVTSAGQPGRL